MDTNTIETNEEVQGTEAQTGLKAHADKLLADLSKWKTKARDLEQQVTDLQNSKNEIQTSITAQLADKQSVIDRLISVSVNEKNDSLINDISMQINKDYPASVRAVIRDHARTEYVDGTYQQYLTNSDGSKFDGDTAAFVKQFSENPQYANIVARDIGGAIITSVTIVPNLDQKPDPIVFGLGR